MRWRHSGVPYSVRSWSCSDRSEMFLSCRRSAVSLVTATSLDEVNGVGGKAVMPLPSKPVLTSS